MTQFRETLDIYFRYTLFPLILYFIFSLKKNALTLLRKSTTFLAKMKNDTGEELEVSDEINVNILTGIGNVMMASSKQADIDTAGNFDKSKVITLHFKFDSFPCHS